MRTIKIALAAAAVFIIFYLVADSGISAQQVIDQDRHLVKYASGIVYDTKTGIEWYAGPDQRTSWEQAMNWVASLSVDGGGWRMPTQFLLASLYHIGDGVNNITFLLDNSGYWIWAVTDKGESSKWVFSFSFGGEGWNGQPPEDGGRALAVRIR